MSKLSASLEDYLETILDLQDENQEAKAIDIANRLNVKKSSVTDALKTLKQKKLVKYAPYKPISLTKEGKKRAEQVAQKHEVLFDFFHNTLGLDEMEAVDNACKIEHVISSKALEKLSGLSSDYKKN